MRTDIAFNATDGTTLRGGHYVPDSLPRGHFDACAEMLDQSSQPAVEWFRARLI